MRRFILWAMAFSFLFSLLNFPVSISRAQDDSTAAPYIYYHDPIQQAIIVERADGSDSHVLGGITMPPDHKIGLGPRFSVGYPWVAWTSRGSSGGDAQLYVVSTDGTERVEAVAGLNRVTHLVWDKFSPLLAIVRTTRDGNSGGSVREYEIITVNVFSHEIVARHTQAADGILSVVWSGVETLVVTYSIQAAPEYDVVYKLLEITGTSRPRRHDQTEIASCFVVGDPFFVGRFYNAILHPTTLGIVYHESGEEVEVPLPEGFPQEVIWSPDGRKLLLVTRPDCETDDALTDYHFWWMGVEDTTLQEILPNGAWTSYSTPVYWSPNGEWAAIASMSGLAYFLNTADGSVTSVPLPPDFNPNITTFDWTSDGNIYMQQGEYGEGVFVLESGATELTPFELPVGSGRAYFSTDGRYIAYAGTCETITPIGEAGCVLNRETGETAVILPPNAAGALGYYFKIIEWHPTADWFFMINGGGAGGGTQFHTIANATGTFQREITSCAYLDCYGWLPDNTGVENMPLLATPRDEPLLRLPLANYLEQTAWSPDGTRIAASSQAGEVRVWDATTGELQLTIPGLSFSWSPDGNSLATAGIGSVNIYDIATGELLQTFDQTFSQVAFSPDGQLIAASTPNTVQFFDAATGEARYTIDYAGVVRALAFSPDSRFIAVVGESTEILVWEVGVEGATRNISVPSATGFNHVTWKADGSQLIASTGTYMFGFGYPTVLLDAATGETVRTLEVSHATFSPDGTQVATITEFEGRLQLHNLSDWQVTHEYYATGWWIAFSPDGTRVAVSNPYVVSIWQLP